MSAQPHFLSLVPTQEVTSVRPRPRPARIESVGIDPDETLPIIARRPAIQPEVLPMKCLRCQGPVEHGVAPVEVERNGFRIVLESVPAWICTRCELPYFEPREVERVRIAVAALQKLEPRRTA